MPDESLWVREVQAPDMSAMRAADRRGGTFLRYFPAPLDERMARWISTEAMEAVSDVAGVVARVAQRLRERPFPILYATLVRSESISSSWVEGLRETPRNVMVAQLQERDPGLSGHQFDRLDTAHAILGNLDSVRRGVESLRAPWTDVAIHDVHRTIAPHVHSGGYRTTDVQIGGSSKLTASYVAPPPRTVSGLMANLLDYANRSGDNALVKAALLHAQFETVHPYEDGNGRTGRVLVHGYLARAAVLDHGVLPLSVVLRRDTDEYVRRLTAFRHGAPGDRHEAVSQFVTWFADVLAAAADETVRVLEQAEAVQDDWAQRLARFRSDSSVHAAVRTLAEQPVVTARYLRSALGVSGVTARAVVDSLVDAGILAPSGGRFRRAEVYQASALLRMMDELVPGIQPTALPTVRPQR
ncbi:Fic family protein [Cellulosimicrobium marinum]|uniref:Fic family protein n=1 Tax=Cellulosimicrobium marinum TaxID=1638992 RepID=UPI001E37ECDE|nr:Fic family protein [Cellulosimicrobium marinum]MCB7136159.1 Fic family protein [Cellulosimicrobium marinum]